MANHGRQERNAWNDFHQSDDYFLYIQVGSSLITALGILSSLSDVRIYINSLSKLQSASTLPNTHSKCRYVTLGWNSGCMCPLKNVSAHISPRS